MQATNLSNFINAILEQVFTSISLVLSQLSSFVGEILRIFL